MKTILTAALCMLLTTITAQKHMDQRAEQKKMANTFIADYQNYSMDIEAAGLASIKEATLSMEGALYVEYAYTSGSENRNGKMTLQLTEKNRLEGNWKTDADNGNSYSGSLYFTFKENGEASGQYKYGGTDYKIAILKKK